MLNLIPTTTLAGDPQSLDNVFELRYRSYRRDDSIELSPSERFSDLFDTMPNHFSFLQSEGEDSIATVRVGVVQPKCNWVESPARRVYGNHPAFQAFANDSYVEASRLCFAPLARRDGFISLLGNVAALAEFHRVRWVLACPRVEHVSVYQHLFGFQPCAEPRTYYGVKFETQLMAISLGQLRAYVQHDTRMMEAWARAGEAICPLSIAC